MRKVAVVGVGFTKFGLSDKTNTEMFAEAAFQALEDANISPKDVEALYFSNVLGEHEDGGQITMAPLAAYEANLKNIPAIRIENACASGNIAFIQACMAVAGGFYDIVLVGGAERCYTMAKKRGTNYATKIFATGGDHRYETPTGYTFPGVFAMMAQRYAYKYGLRMGLLEERMAKVAVKNHSNALYNPIAHFQRKITVEDVLNSPKIAEPLKLLDCCPFSDGAAAVVIASEDVARKITDTPIYVRGIGMASNGPLYRQEDITRVIARELSAKKAYKMAGVESKDIDVVECHDCFTIAEIVAYEGLGLCKHGEGHRLIEDGVTDINGDVPVNPSGGLKAKGHPLGATGVAQVGEITLQLRAEAGRRQVDGAEIGLVDTLGGDLAIVGTIILSR